VCPASKGWFGGDAGRLWPQHRIFQVALISHMTAIAMAYTASGFILAADGRSRWDDENTADEITRQQEKEDEQKIFRVESRDRSFAYALMGSISNKDGSYNLIRSARQESSALTTKSFNSLHAYVEAFSFRIKRHMDDAKRDGRNPIFVENPNPDPNESGTIVRFFFAAYLRKRKPAWAVARFFHINQILADPHIFYENPVPGCHPLLCGPGRYTQLFTANDSRFAAYKKPFGPSSSLQQAAEYAEGYIAGCSDPVALQEDPVCAGVGGRTHIAGVTSEGFKWLDGYQPSTSAG